MTENIDYAEYGKKVRALFLTHLEGRGFPNMGTVQLLNELPALWQALSDAGLKPEGLDYLEFRNIAVFQAMNAEVNSL